MAWAVFGDDQKQAIEEIIASRSDRILAIVGGAILDRALRRTIEERLREDKDISNKLFRVNGALGNTEPKVDLLYLLRGIEKPVRNALYGLIQVRNVFAHVLDAAFDNPDDRMQDGLSKLRLHEGRKFYPHHLYDEDSKISIEKVDTNRMLFIVNLQLCLIALMRDRVSHESFSHIPVSEDELRKRRGEPRA